MLFVPHENKTIPPDSSRSRGGVVAAWRRGAVAPWWRHVSPAAACRLVVAALTRPRDTEVSHVRGPRDAAVTSHYGRRGRERARRAG
ncbi:hypothetical protein EYF80_064624 [Liparis tanakae]|uniref:Uncharacterized protein n=1 Tax=Liparis tanakae TaxID=230148 RepID=A0A4Z2E8V6_9TELE|nr:hypothetical protein EYF80_064624 [Liparis tanakae]